MSFETTRTPNTELETRLRTALQAMVDQRVSMAELKAWVNIVDLLDYAEGEGSPMTFKEAFDAVVADDPAAYPWVPAGEIEELAKELGLLPRD